MKKSLATITLLLTCLFVQQGFAASKTVNLTINRSTMSRQLSFFNGINSVNYTFQTDSISDGTVRGENAYVQLINTGGIWAATNIIDNCLSQAKSDKVELQMTLNSAGVSIDPPNTSVLNLKYKPSFVSCYEVR